MAATKMSSTTLSAAIVSTDTILPVAATTGITVGMNVVIRNEAMKVLAVPPNTNALTIQVIRGVGGTRPRNHASGAIAWFAAPDSWKTLRDHALAVIGDVSALPDYLMPGQKATDGAGREYILLQPNTTIYGGSTVLILMDGTFACQPLTNADHGPVALLVEQSTSAQFAWGQIYGDNSYAQDESGTTAATSAYVPTAASTATAPNVGMAVVSPTSTDQPLIYGMFITGIATTATTAATSATGCAVPVFLNYPYVLGWNSNVLAPTT